MRTTDSNDQVIPPQLIADEPRSTASETHGLPVTSLSEPRTADEFMLVRSVWPPVVFDQGSPLGEPDLAYLATFNSLTLHEFHSLPDGLHTTLTGRLNNFARFAAQIWEIHRDFDPATLLARWLARAGYYGDVLSYARRAILEYGTAFVDPDAADQLIATYTPLLRPAP